MTDTLSPHIQEVLAAYHASQERELAGRRDPEWIKNNPPTLDNLARHEWWRSAREKLVGLDPGSDGGSFCGYWTDAMFNAVKEYAEAHPDVDISLVKKYSAARDHFWLELESSAFDPFVADGTAGQINTLDPDYLQGVYEDKNALIATLQLKNDQIAHMYQNTLPIESFVSKNRLKRKPFLHTLLGAIRSTIPKSLLPETSIHL